MIPSYRLCRLQNDIFPNNRKNTRLRFFHAEKIGSDVSNVKESPPQMIHRQRQLSHMKAVHLKAAADRLPRSLHSKEQLISYVTEKTGAVF